MPITEEQRIARRDHVGSSDLAAICGLDPYKSSYDVYLSKTQEIEDYVPSEAAEAGNILEPSVLAWAEQKLGTKLIVNQNITSGGVIAVNADALRVDNGNPVEAKTSGITSRWVGESWGDEGTDEIPARVVVQCYALMLCTDTELCHVPALIGGRGFGMWRVTRADDLMVDLVERAERFWRDHVEPRVPPSNSLPSMDIVKRIVRSPRKTVVIDPVLVAKWHELRTERLALAKREDQAKAAMLAALGDADAGEFGDDTQLLTYFETVSERKAQPARTVKSRTPRLKKRGN